MPKGIGRAIIWVAEEGRYVRREPESADFKPVPAEELWFSWLAACSAFAFQGQEGHLTLRKEARARRGEYWYAYRCQNQRTVKRYAGRTGELTLTRLEEIAAEINSVLAAARSGRQPRPRPAPLEAEQPATLIPLLTPKLGLPRLQRALIVRERLLAQLDAGLELPLTLLCAPAGSGKTTLVRQWIALRGEQDWSASVAWISLDAGDNDPIRFWRSVMAATHNWYASSEQQIFRLLFTTGQSYLQPLLLEIVLTAFLNEVALRDVAGVLVLEDYHVIVEPRIHEAMSFLLAHLPEQLHVLMLSRQEPPLPLARLRANGELNEIRSIDLRFSLAESAEFLKEFVLPAQVLERLDAYLEGWAAGLRLLALSLQGKTTQPQIERALSTFSGSQRPLLDYFVTEVLNTQPDAIQQFLLRTSVLPRLTPALCAAVTGWQESAVLLEQIEHDNLFLEALDEAGAWYRYHALFAEAMQHEARRRLGEEEVCRLSQLAGHWFEEQGLLTEAIEAALRAREKRRAADLMEQFFQSPQVQETREYHTLRRWLEQLPAPLLQQSPNLCFGYAVALTFERGAQEPEQVLSKQIEDLLQRAEEGWGAQGDSYRLGPLYAFRAMFALRQGKLATATAWAREALSLLPAEDVIWRSTALSVMAFQAMQNGSLAEARQLFQQVDSLAVAANRVPMGGMATLFLSIVCVAQGELRQAARYYRKLASTNNQQKAIPASVFAALPMALVYYEWNELATLQQQTQELIALAERFSSIPQTMIQVAIEIILATLQHAQGETRAAVQRLTNLWARRSAARHDVPFYLYQEALCWLVRLSLLLADQESAQRWLNELVRYHWQCKPDAEEVPQLQAPTSVLPSVPEHRDESWHIPAHLREQRVLLMARLALLRGEVEKTLDLLEPLWPEAQAAGRGRNLLQIRLLLAQAYAMCKQPVQARQWLLQALEQGYPEGYQRCFVDEGEALIPLLRDILPYLPSDPLRDYVHILLQAFPHAPGQEHNALSIPTLTEPLSPQEQRVLRLLMIGRSNAEIARELVVSVNTVRTQLQSIYRKLQVNDRHTAREVAHQLHLG
jgi:LuxR family maltose regulon positive regulatory protein